MKNNLLWDIFRCGMFFVGHFALGYFSKDPDFTYNYQNACSPSSSASRCRRRPFRVWKSCPNITRPGPATVSSCRSAAAGGCCPWSCFDCGRPSRGCSTWECCCRAAGASAGGLRCRCSRSRWSLTGSRRASAGCLMSPSRCCCPRLRSQH